jgi:hypothetical protein
MHSLRRHLLPWYGRNDCVPVSMQNMEGVNSMHTVCVTNVLVYCDGNFALVHLVDRLRLHGLAVHIALLIQDLLKRVVFPSKDVITVISISGASKVSFLMPLCL